MVDTNADTGMDVFFRGLEPCVSLRLNSKLEVGARKRGKETRLLEDVMEQSIVGVVVHVDDGTRAERVGAATHTRTRGGDEQAGLDG